MNLPIKLPGKLTRLAGKLLLKAKKSSPEACVISGIICGGAALVIVGVKTWKSKDILEADAKAIKDIKYEEGTQLVKKTELTDEDKKLLVAKRIDFAKDICKVYWLPGVLSVSSVVLLWGGRTLLRKDLGAVTAAYSTLMESYKKYREKVIAEYGKEKDQEFMYGAKTTQFVDGETGEVVTGPFIDKKHNISQYAFYFDPGEYDSETGEWIWKNFAWDDSKSGKMINKLRIRNAQNWATDKLNSRGWVLLAEVADMLGAKPNPAWYRVGWYYKEGQQNFVELGVLEGEHQLPFNRGFTDEDNPQNVCIVEPNVDGCIDFVFTDIEQYDKRCGKRAHKKKRMPSNAEMFGAEFARKLGY